MSRYNQLPLADELWMVAHDRPDGRPLLHDKPLCIGLACALLCEALLLEWIADVDAYGRLHLIDGADRYRPSTDTAICGVLTPMIRQAGVRGLPVDEQIQRLVADAHPLVLRRLQSGGHLQRQTVGGLLRSSRTTYVTPLTSTSGWPAARLKQHLTAGEELVESDLALAGLIIAIGLDTHALAGLGRREREFLARQMHAKLRPALYQLILRAEAAVGRIALTR